MKDVIKGYTDDFGTELPYFEKDEKFRFGVAIHDAFSTKLFNAKKAIRNAFNSTIQFIYDVIIGY